MNACFETSAPACQNKSSTREAERTALAVEVLQRSGWLCLRVRGESMLPTLWPGDEVEIAHCSSSEIRRGDVVLASCQDRFFLHRVCKVSENGEVVTRGDAMPAPDPAMPAESFVGKLTRVTRAGRTSPVPARYGVLRRALGIVFWYLSPARHMALTLHSWRMMRFEIAESKRPAEPVPLPFGNLASDTCDLQWR